MRRVWTGLPRLLLAALMLTLVACGASSSTTDGREGEGLWTRVTAFFSDIAERIATVPLIGAWFAKVLAKLAPEDHWCVGGVMAALVLAVLAAVFHFVRE